MNAHSVISRHVIYLAPMQGFTDYSFRKAFFTLFDPPDLAFSPLIETHKTDHRTYRDVLPDRNTGIPLVPQVLGNNAEEMQRVIAHLKELGYTHFNWNLGCPYPMVTKRQMGAGLLPHPQVIERSLNELFKDNTLQLSVKMRLGLANPDDWKTLIPVLNSYPLTEIIIHGRTASQMYNGEVNESAVHEMTSQLAHPVCYNGNINSLDDFQALSNRMPGITRWMIGRGLISNPLLIKEIRTNRKADQKEIKSAISLLHDQLVYQNSLSLSGESHLMNKLKFYWEYFGKYFPDSRKVLKKIKKSTTFNAYNDACKEFFS